ncbi:MAG: 3-phosphoglycerate dehydrogenase, partial [Clostridia bacterium]|nr:3-phosphoglycerate dehydrogenase [Clostridia bacterium]
MTNIKLYNKISPIGLDLLDKDQYACGEDYEEFDAALVRSAVLHEVEFPQSLLAIARAGAGVNNIPLDKCAEKGIVVFNTPGANANGVKELAIAGLLLASRDIVGGINWVQTIKEDETVAKLVEKGKSKFAGQEIMGKKLGIIGLGAIGGPLANAAVSLGMDVYGCDPYLSVDGAWKLSRSVHHVKTREEIFSTCDYISVHTPLVENADP